MCANPQNKWALGLHALRGSLAYPGKPVSNQGGEGPFLSQPAAPRQNNHCLPRTESPLLTPIPTLFAKLGALSPQMAEQCPRNTLLPPLSLSRPYLARLLLQNGWAPARWLPSRPRTHKYVCVWKNRSAPRRLCSFKDAARRRSCFSDTCPTCCAAVSQSYNAAGQAAAAAAPTLTYTTGKDSRSDSSGQSGASGGGGTAEPSPCGTGCGGAAALDGCERRHRCRNWW